MYKNGIGTNKNLKISQRYFKQAFIEFKEIADKNPNDFIQYRLGKMYYSGEGIEKDLNKAKELFQKSAESKDSDYINNKDYQVYVKYLKEASFKGNTTASNELAYIYSKQMNDMSDGIALHYYSLDKTDNSYNLGRHYLTLAKNIFYSSKDSLLNDNIQYINNLLEKARNYLKNADQENSYTLLNMGSLYLLEGTKIYNKEKGIDFLEKSYQQGNDSAGFSLGKLYYNDAKKLIQNQSNYTEPLYQEKLTSYCEKAIKYFSTEPINNMYSQYFLGETYLIKDSFTYDKDKAIHFLKKSIKNENKLAAFTLGKLYLNEAIEANANLKKSVNVSNDEKNKISEKCNLALKYLNQSNQEDSYVKIALAKTYLIEESNTFNSEKAINLLNTLALNNNDIAQYNLGKLYLFGNKEIKQDIPLATFWLKKAKENGNTNAASLLSERDRYIKKQAIVKGYRLFLDIFNNMNEKNQYQEELKSKIGRKDKTKIALKEKTPKNEQERDD